MTATQAALIALIVLSVIAAVRYETDAAWCSVMGRVPVWTVGASMVCEP